MCLHRNLGIMGSYPTRVTTRLESDLSNCENLLHNRAQINKFKLDEELDKAFAYPLLLSWSNLDLGLDVDVATLAYVLVFESTLLISWIFTGNCSFIHLLYTCTSSVTRTIRPKMLSNEK